MDVVPNRRCYPLTQEQFKATAIENVQLDSLFSGLFKGDKYLGGQGGPGDLQRCRYTTISTVYYQVNL